MMSEKLRFLFASVDAPPRVGGVSQLARALSISLTDRHASEAVFVGPNGTFFEKDGLNFKVYEDFQSDTKLRAGPASPLEDQRIEDLFDRIIQSYALNCVIVWHPFYYGIGAIRAAQKNRIPCAVFVHGTELSSQVPSVYVDHTRPLYRESSTDLPDRLLRTLKSADIIFTNSSFSRDLIVRAMPTTKVEVLGCGIDASVLENESLRIPEYRKFVKAIYRERLGLAERQTLIQVGRMVPHKNHFASIDLLAEMPDAQLVIIGDGPFRPQIENYIKQKGCGDKVILIGSCSDDKKWDYIRASDVGLLLSEFSDETGGYEGFGIVMLEYTAGGCIPYTNGKFGMADFSMRFGAGLVGMNATNLSTRQFAQQLSTEISNEELMNEKLQHARHVIANRYTWSLIADKSIDILRDMTENE